MKNSSVLGPRRQTVWRWSVLAVFHACGSSGRVTLGGSVGNLSQVDGVLIGASGGPHPIVGSVGPIPPPARVGRHARLAMYI